MSAPIGPAATDEEPEASGRARPGTVVAVVLAVALAAVGLALSVWRPLAPPVGDVTTDLDTFSPEVTDAVEAYRSPRWWMGLGQLALLALVPLALVLVPAGRRLLRRLAAGGRPLLRAALLGGAVVLLSELVRLPLSYAAGFAHDSAWGFRQSGPGLWFRDWGVSTAITAGAVGAGAALLLGLVRRRPGTWHWWLVPGVTGVAALLALVWPLAVEPLFLSTRPLEEGPVRAAVEDVLAAAGEEDLGLEVGDASRRTTRVNAFVTGLGPSRRVVLYDNLLDLPPDQVAYVVAHELAHRQHADIPRGVLLSATGALPVALVLRRLWDAPGVRRRLAARDGRDPVLVGVALAVLAVVQVVGVVPANLASRRVEAAADARALELTGDPAGQIEVARVFTVRDLSHPEPPGWVTVLFRTHPAVGQRIRAAVAHADRTGAALPDLEDLRRGEAAARHERVGSD